MINIDDYEISDYEKNNLKEVRLRLSELDVKGQIKYLSDLLCDEFYLNEHIIYIGRILTELLIANGIEIKGAS